MKRKKPKYNGTKPKWTTEQLEFLSTYFGAIKTTSIATVLQRGNDEALRAKAGRSGIKPNPRQYGEIEVVYMGVVYTVQAFNKPKESTRIPGRRVGRPSLLVPKKPSDYYKPKGNPIGRPKQHLTEPEEMGRKAKPTLRAAKPDHKYQEKGVIKPFVAPKNKVLVYCEIKRGMVYR